MCVDKSFLCYFAIHLCCSTYVNYEDVCFMSYELLKCCVYGVIDDTFCENLLVFGFEFSHVGLGDFWKGLLRLCCVDEFEVLYCLIGRL